jgi:holo-[acyl-carrier-protein] synthase
MKALGQGWGPQLGWLDIEVRRRPGSRPEILLSGRAKAYAASLGVRRLHLALTHTTTLAEAQVVAEGEG